MSQKPNPPTFFAPPSKPQNWIVPPFTIPTGSINHASLAGLTDADTESTQYLLTPAVGKKKCDEMGCKDGKVLLLHSSVNCKKCNGTGEL